MVRWLPTSTGAPSWSTSPASPPAVTASATSTDGRVVFVRGGLPGDRVRCPDRRRARPASPAASSSRCSSRRRAASPRRVRRSAPAAAAAAGSTSTSPCSARLKAGIVTDALERIGRPRPPPPRVDPGPDLPATAYRTTVRAAVDDTAGRLPRAPQPTSTWPSTTPAASSPTRSSTRCSGSGTSSPATRSPCAPARRPVSGSSSSHPAEAPSTSPPCPTRPSSVPTSSRSGRRVWFHEDVAGRRWRISARSFFQARPDGAEALADAVAAAVLAADVARRPSPTCTPASGFFAGVLADRLPGPLRRLEVVEANRGGRGRRPRQPRRRRSGPCRHRRRPPVAPVARSTSSSPTRPATASVRDGVDRIAATGARRRGPRVLRPRRPRARRRSPRPAPATGSPPPRSSTCSRTRPTSRS